MEGGTSWHQEDPRRRIIPAPYVFCINYRTGLAQLVERVTAEWEVVGSIPGAGPKLGVLK